MNAIEIIKEKIKNNSYYLDNGYLSIDNMDNFPIINKNIVIHNYDRMICSTENMVAVYTSGSNGMPLKVYWDYKEYIRSLASLWRLRKLNGIYSTDFFLTCHAYMDIWGRIVNEPIVISHNYLSLSKVVISEEICEEYLHYIKLLKPIWIYAQPSFVYYLGLYLKNNSPEILDRFKYIELVGELLTPDVRKSIQCIFQNAHICNMYGMQEFNGIMYEKNEKMYSIPENVFVEIINDNGFPCDYNEEGRIVVSGLKNSVLPLIRYDTGDRGKKLLFDNNNTYIITSGRSNDELWYKGKRYDGSIFFSTVNQYNKERKNKIIRFQVIYENNSLQFLITTIDSFHTDASMEADIKNILYSMYGIDIPINIIVTCDPTDYCNGQGKIKYFINKMDDLKYCFV